MELTIGSPQEMEYLLIEVSPIGFPIEVEGKAEVDWLGGSLDDLFENLSKNVPSAFFARLLRPPSELPGSEGGFD